MRIIKLIFIALLLVQCATGRMAIDGQTFKAYAHAIPLRGGQEYCLNNDNVSILVRGYEFAVKSNSFSLNLKYTHVIDSEPNLLIGESETGMRYIVYYYAYRGRMYLQITPIPKGYNKIPIENEVAYIITTDKICN